MEAETPQEIVGLADVGTPAVKAREDVNVIHASTWGTENGATDGDRTRDTQIHKWSNTVSASRESCSG